MSLSKIINLSPVTYSIHELVDLLKRQRLDLTKESNTQKQLAVILEKNNYGFVRHIHLDANNIPDFFDAFSGIAIEVKVKGTRKGIFRQCVRYCQFDQVKALILCSNKSMGIPGEILGKPVYFVNLSKAWL